MSKGVERENKIEMASVLFSTTRAMEVSFENSFQPTIQLYIILPQLLRQFVSEHDKVQSMY